MGLQFKKPTKFCQKTPEVVEKLMDLLPEIPKNNEDHQYQNLIGVKKFLEELDEIMSNYYNNLTHDESEILNSFLGEFQHSKINKMFYFIGLIKGVQFWQKIVTKNI